MSQKTINKSLQKTLLSPLTHDLLWSQFLDTFSYEIQNMRDEYSLIKNNWNIDKNDKSNLIRISESFGYTPNLIIDNTTNMSKLEINSIPYRIREKTTYNGYSLIFQQNASKGETFNYYWNGKKLIKVIDYKKTLDNLINSNHYSPFFEIEPIKNYSSLINSPNINLDYLVNGQVKYDTSNVRLYSLDQFIGSSVWKLDTSYIQIPTKHLGIEYFPQNYYCSYKCELTMIDENQYESQIQMINYYIPKSITIYVNNVSIETTVTTIGNKEFFHDDLNILGENSYFDFYENLVHLEFNDDISDYKVSISYNIDLLITSDYFYYLELGMEYNRRCPIIPHCGVFLSADIAQSRGSDFYHPNENGYTVPDLKLKAITTSAYNRFLTLNEPSFLDNSMDAQGQPSGKENYKLDSVVKWFLDTATSQNKSLIDEFKYISCGNKALNIINEEFNQTFNQNSIIFYYNLNTDDDNSTILDISSNQMNCDIVGDIVKINSVIDKSLNFNGETYAHSTSSLVIDSSKNYTFGMWFKCTYTENTNETLFDSFIKISYDYNNYKLIIDSNKYDCSANDYHFLNLLFDTSANKCKVYIDCILKDEFNFTIQSTSNLIYIGTDSTEASNFYGEIDNVWLLSKILTDEQMNYIYDNKISVISHIGNKIARYELTDDEKYDNENYSIIQSYVKSMDVNDEGIMLDNSNDNEYFISKTKFSPIIPSYFYMTYTNLLNRTITIQSNEKGEFYNKSTGEIITGNVDFEKGTWKLAKNTIKSISQKVIDSPNSEEYFNAYEVTDVDENKLKWYQHKEGNEYINEINGDYFDTDDGEILESEFIYTSEDDKTASQSDIYIYSKDNNEYYIPNNKTNIPIAEFNANADSDETPLFSFDNGKTLYPKLLGLVNDYNKSDINERVCLRSFSDMGEATGTPLYTIAKYVTSDEGYSDDSSEENYAEIYLNIGSACISDSSMRVRKWKVLDKNDNPINVYTLGDVNESDLTQNKYYSNLSFTSQINSPHSIIKTTFSPMYSSIKDTQIDLNLSLKKSAFKYSKVYAITNIEMLNVIVDNYKLVKNSISFNYWLEKDGAIKKCTALINEEGGISDDGSNIEYGSFNYETNVLNVKFIDKISSDISISYEYYYSLELDYTKPLVMNYKIEKSIKINEIGLENENHELMAYMTFPNVEFHTIYDNLSAMFTIKKS